ncbi:hypothetical protein WDV93_19440 [Pantoea ananatis]
MQINNGPASSITYFQPVLPNNTGVNAASRIKERMVGKGYRLGVKSRRRPRMSPNFGTRRRVDGALLFCPLIIRGVSRHLWLSGAYRQRCTFIKPGVGVLNLMLTRQIDGMCC